MWTLREKNDNLPTRVLVYLTHSRRNMFDDLLNTLTHITTVEKVSLIRPKDVDIGWHDKILDISLSKFYESFKNKKIH